MSNYRRANTPGATYFFTVVTHKRKPVFNTESAIDLLRDAFHTIHIHCLWRLPENDNDFSGRWREIKKFVTQRIANVRNARNEGGIWQRRFWEHQIRNEKDWQNHMDYIHFNPVRHGYVTAAKNWQWSSFYKWVRKGAYTENWGSNVMPESIKGMEFE